jgi:hypothetical protein
VNIETRRVFINTDVQKLSLLIWVLDEVTTSEGFLGKIQEHVHYFSAIMQWFVWHDAEGKLILDTNTSRLLFRKLRPKIATTINFPNADGDGRRKKIKGTMYLCRITSVWKQEKNLPNLTPKPWHTEALTLTELVTSVMFMSLQDNTQRKRFKKGVPKQEKSRNSSEHTTNPAAWWLD